MTSCITFDGYSDEACKTARYKDAGTGSALAFEHLSLLMMAESGELAEGILKFEKRSIDSELLEYIKQELGDLAWYASQFSREHGIKLSTALKTDYVAEFQAKAQLPENTDGMNIRKMVAWLGVFQGQLQASCLLRSSLYGGHAGTIRDYYESLAAISKYFGLSFEDVLVTNLEKLRKRQDAGTLIKSAEGRND